MTKLIVEPKVVKHLIEKMRITGSNQWTPISDVTFSPKETGYVESMVQNGLLDRQNNLVRFASARIFSIIDAITK